MLTVRALSLGIVAASLVGCGSSVPEGAAVMDEVVPSLPVQTAAFTPLVPASTATPTCQSVPLPNTLSIVYGDPVDRRINVEFDDSDEPVRYVDMRGDLIVYEPHEDQTTIQVDFRSRAAMGVNRRGESRRASQLSFSAALNAENLGNPLEMIELVRTLCAGAF